MWISIFSSDIKALCSLAVAPSKNTSHVHYSVLFLTSEWLMLWSVKLLFPPVLTWVAQISPFSILTATVSKLLLLLIPQIEASMTFPKAPWPKTFPASCEKKKKEQKPVRISALIDHCWHGFGLCGARERFVFGSSLQNVNASGIYMDDGVGCVVGVGVELESELRHLENNALARAALVEQMLFLTALSRSHTGNKDIFNISTLFGSTLLDWMRSKLTPLRILEMENKFNSSILLAPGPRLYISPPTCLAFFRWLT